MLSTRMVPRQWPFAHQLRGVAALAVLVFHTTGMFWAHPNAVASLLHVPAPTSSASVGEWPRLISGDGWFNLGSFGVGLFFLISGFVVPYAVLGTSRSGFLVARALRLWPTYGVGLVTSALALSGAAFFFGRPLPWSLSQLAIHALLGVRDLTGTPSLDGIVWTLEVEVRFYLLCAFLAPLLRRGSNWDLLGTVSTLVAVVAVVAAIDLWGGRVWGTDPFWARLRGVVALDGAMITFMLIGTALHFRVRQTASGVAVVVASMGAYAAFGVLIGLDPAAGPLRPTLVSYGAALGVFLAAFGLRHRITAGGLGSRLANISYPLYVLHAVPGYVLMRVLVAHGSSAVAAVAAAWIWALASASLVHVYVEQPTHQWGRRLGKRLSTRVTGELSGSSTASTAARAGAWTAGLPRGPEAVSLDPGDRGRLRS